ncbi:MAG: DUF6458 family protein [Euzebya sp.]
MAIGSAIALFVLGAILVYGVDIDLAGLDIDVIGYILMLAGLIGGVLGLAFMGSRRRSRTTRSMQETHRTADGGHIVETEIQR